ncbi:MAG TPA: DUF3313 family protein [Thermomonas sp.]|nr:DUF3313 family protein [Thermomonas sp.]
MKGIAKFLLFSALAGAMGVAASQSSPEVPTSKRAASSAWSEDGLQKTFIKGLDVVYVRPGSSLAGYDKVMLKPVSVAFRRNWGRPTPGTPGVRVRAEDAQRIREKLTAVLLEETIKQLQEGGYAVVDAAGDDVLEVQASISDLYITAPDVPGAVNTTVFSVSAGEMTLVADLRDSVSGETMVRVYDHGYARESAFAHRITNMENATEARQLVREWAKQLRLQLDLAKNSGGATP